MCRPAARMRRGPVVAEGRSRGHRVEVPCARHAFELARASVLEAQARADDEVSDGARHENLASLRQSGYARADMNRDPADILATHLAFPGVNACANFQAERADGVADRN